MELQELEDRYTELKLDFKQYIGELCNNIVDNDDNLLLWVYHCGSVFFYKHPNGKSIRGHSSLQVELENSELWSGLAFETWNKLKVLRDILDTEIAKTVMWEKEAE